MYETRINNLCSKMNQLGVPVSILFNPTNLKYFTGTKFASALVLSCKTTPLLVTSSLMASQTENEALIGDIVKFPATNMFIEKNLKQIMANLVFKKNKRGVELDYLSAAFFNKLTKSFPHLNFVDISPIINDLRKRKSQDEINLIRKAAEIAAEGIKIASNFIEPGMSELEVSAKIDSVMKKKGAEELGFTTTVASGPRTSLYYPKASNKRIKRGEVVVVDIGPVFRGYHADMTRTMVLGKPTKKLLNVYDLVKKIEDKALESIHIGAPCSKITEVGHSVVKSTSYAKYSYTLFEIGHGVGLENREPPLLNIENDETISSNMTIAIEPIICLKEFGVRLEDTIVICGEGPEIMTKFNRNIVRI